MNTDEDPSGSRAEGISQRFVSGLVEVEPSPFKSAALTPVPPPAILVELVERFHVCWETVPEFSLLESQRRQIGFALELYGNHDSSAEHPAETCIHCQNVFGSLHVIADWALPRGKRAMMHEAEIHFPCHTHAFPRQNQQGFVLQYVSYTAEPQTRSMKKP